MCFTVSLYMLSYFAVKQKYIVFVNTVMLIVD